MKILIIGGNGTIGNKVTAELKKRHEVVVAGRKSGDVNVDLASEGSIEKMFQDVPNLDAVISIAGATKWGNFEDLTEEDFYISIRNKLMGQVNLVRIGQRYLKDNGSFTLTTGILGEDPVKGSVGASMVNGGIHSFVIATARELKRGLRINVVAPGLVEDAADRQGHLFPGHLPVTMKRTVSGYLRSVEGYVTGEVIRLY